MIKEIQEISKYFIKSSEDEEELKKLIEVAGDKERWINAHTYFNEVRNKNLNVSNNDEDLKSLYNFIEVCYKSIYNLTHPSAPFDSYSPFKVVQNAIKHCRIIGVEPTEIIQIIE